jgi:hypothetical protein
MAEGVDAGRARPPGERSTAELVQQAAEQVSRLVRDEIALARSELMEKGRHAGAGAGLLGGGGLVALYGVGALVLAAIAGLAEAMPAWVAALIVAGAMALLGRQQVRQAVPPVPEGATRGVRADVEAVTAAVRERGRS